MEFSENKPIYIQIADDICNRILSGSMKPGERVLSVREWSARIGVNPNTVARSYDLLETSGVIRAERGIGFFVSADARERILESERKTFVEKELPALKARAALLGIDLKTLL